MPVDARIPLGVEPVKMPDFAQLAVQRASVMNNMAEMAAKQRALNEQNTLAQIVQSPGYDPTNPEWRKKTATMAPNLGSTFLKAQDDAAAAQADAQAKAFAQKEAQTKSALMELFQYSDFESAEAALDAKVASGQLQQAQADAAKARMRGSPDYQTFAFNHARSMLTPEQLTEVTRTTQELGDRRIVTATPTRAPVGTAPVTEAIFDMGISPDQAADNARAAASERQQSTRPLTATNMAGDFMVMNPNILNDPRMNPTGASSIVIPGAGKPSGGFERAQAARGESYSQIAAALPVLDELLKPGSNVDKAGGGVPTFLMTNLARAFGQTTDEMKAQAKLGPEGYVLLQQVPRFEGPQSDKDTAAYKDAAGKLTNEFSTAGEKRAALEAIKAILLRNKAYLDANPQVGAAKTGGGGATSGAINWTDMQ